MCFIYSVGTTSRPPKWIKPQLTRLVGEAPASASTDYHWSVNDGCHPERCEGPLMSQERSRAALGMTVGTYQTPVILGTSWLYEIKYDGYACMLGSTAATC